MAQLPVLPHGSPSIFSTLSESLSFHASPESFITARVLAFRSQHPDLAEARVPIRAKVLNRNVAVISSYKHVIHLLGDEASKLSSSKAYDELLAPFFPPPNLLLSDPPDHDPMKKKWRVRMAELSNQVCPKVEAITMSHFRGIQSGSAIDLYRSMKSLSWKLILSLFLPDSPSSSHRAPASAEQFIKLQEDLLRGQFSLFPLSINTRWWTSPRAKGIAARKQLQAVLRERMGQAHPGCPFSLPTSSDKDDVAAHSLLFTSSLAVKALASLLTALMLNLYARDSSETNLTCLAERVGRTTGDKERHDLINSIIQETERLSPPVVGIMRRSIDDVVLPADENNPTEILIPKNWDAWLYFVGAARDPAIYGSTADIFTPDRYCGDQGREKGFAFGAGPKMCLGENLIREVVRTCVKVCIDMDAKDTTTAVVLRCDKSGLAPGLLGWLGHRGGVKSEDWARDMKQLPTQRPTKPIVVTLDHRLDK